MCVLVIICQLFYLGKRIINKMNKENMFFNYFRMSEMVHTCVMVNKYIKLNIIRKVSQE